jgi:hypothetical protein
VHYSHRTCIILSTSVLDRPAFHQVVARSLLKGVMIEQKHKERLLALVMPQALP